MKTAKDLTRGELELIVSTTQQALWLARGGPKGKWDADKEWSWDHVEDIAGSLIDAGLRPDYGSEG